MHLNVADLDRSQAFYESMGMELMAESGSGNEVSELGWIPPSPRHQLARRPGAAPVEPEVRGFTASR